MTIVYCDFFAGCFGGAVGTLIGHPLDTIKTWQQTTNSKIGSSIYKIIVRNNGLNGFYRGMLFPIYTTGALNSILFGIYGNQLRILQEKCQTDDERKLYWRKHVFISGSVAGFLQSFIACPLELIKIRLQTQNYYVDYRRGETRGPVSCINRIIKFEGFKGFYHGLLPMICRDVFPYGIYMLAYEQLLKLMGNIEYVKEQREINRLQNNLSVNSWLEMNITIISGAVAGLLSWILVIPFDVIKTIIQAESSSMYYKNMLHCLETNVQKSGWRILFRGSWMLIFRSMPVNASTFLAYEFALEKCKQITK